MWDAHVARVVCVCHRCVKWSCYPAVLVGWTHKSRLLLLDSSTYAVAFNPPMKYAIVEGKNTKKHTHTLIDSTIDSTIPLESQSPGKGRPRSVAKSSTKLWPVKYSRTMSTVKIIMKTRPKAISTAFNDRCLSTFSNSFSRPRNIRRRIFSGFWIIESTSSLPIRYCRDDGDDGHVTCSTDGRLRMDFIWNAWTAGKTSTAIKKTTKFVIFATILSIEILISRWMPLSFEHFPGFTLDG